MKKYLTIGVLIFVFPLLVSAQSDSIELQFDTKFYNARDKWVVFPKSPEDSTYAYGFIYIDRYAGFTFAYKSQFYIKDQEFVAIEDTSNQFLRYRLGARTKSVAVLKEQQLKQLNLQEKPSWLNIYNQFDDSAAYFIDLGIIYNEAQAPQKALHYLLRAKKIDPDIERLAFELAYSYNVLNNHQKAVNILKRAIKKNPEKYLLYMELGYTYLMLNQIEKAENAYKRGIKITKKRSVKTQMAYNMARSFFKLKNKKKFEEWAELVEKFATEDSKLMKYIKIMRKKWDKANSSKN